jgi:predicted RNA-binding protein YlxR (DUF448 family)
VRVPDEGVRVDELHRRPGRGAYLCDRVACWERAILDQQGRGIARALRLEAAAPDREQLLAYAEERFGSIGAVSAATGGAR